VIQTDRVDTLISFYLGAFRSDSGMDELQQTTEAMQKSVTPQQLDEDLRGQAVDLCG